MSTDLSELAAVRDAISKKQPFCSGIRPLTDNTGILFFRKSGDMAASWVDLASADEVKLQSLVEACEPAAFGVGNKDVLDDTYRKAWKMDSSDFSTRFDVVNPGILDHVRVKLLQGNTERKIGQEMYKLNVYGPGSFFKAHKDTPRSENMFGSLVVVFPTRHEGGALQLRHKGEEWTFDSAAMTSAQETPSVAYIAFYSDVEHEVSMVTAGYRVTLTYNLYFDDTTPDLSHIWMQEDEMALLASLSALVENRDVLPDGGYLGFGLDFMYPIGPGEDKLVNLINSLKGSDAKVKRVLDHLNLEPQLKVVYEDVVYQEEEDEEEEEIVEGFFVGQYHQRTPGKGVQIMLDEVDRFPVRQTEEGLLDALSARSVGGIVICGANEELECKDADGEIIRAEKVLWITPLTTFSSVRSDYITYGNEASLGYSYGNLCLVAPVSASGKRVKVKARQAGI